MQIKHLALAVVFTSLLSGCLENDVQRAAAGAAAGAVIADVTNGDVLTGAVIGAGAGALCDDVGVCN